MNKTSLLSLAGLYLVLTFVNSTEASEPTRKDVPKSHIASTQPTKTWKQREFIITFWCPPPVTDENMAAAARENFNLAWTPVEKIDLVAKHGLRAMLQSNLLKPNVLEDPAKRAQLDALIDKIKKHPALEAYYITDEPGAGAFAGLGKLVAYLRERDPEHLAYINLYPTYANESQLGVSANAVDRAKVGYPQNFEGVGTSDKTVLAYREHVRKFIETVNPALISYDHYHFLKKSDGAQYFLNLALIRMAAQEAQLPFLNIIQASDGEITWRLPNADETRWLVYTTLAYGGRGISYFLYWGTSKVRGIYVDGKPTPMAKEIATLNGEMLKLGPTLLKLDSTGVYHTAPLPYGTEAVPDSSPVQVVGKGEYVLGLFGQSGKVNSFMIVNRNYKQPAEATLKISVPGRKLEELDRATGKWNKYKDLNAERIVRIDLKPGDGRLIRLAE